MQRLEDSQFPLAETPAKPLQTVAAFRLCRSPVLNAWYRLAHFSPAPTELRSVERVILH